jgi:peptide/nickel transport system substrate-binding protein
VEVAKSPATNGKPINEVVWDDFYGEPTSLDPADSFEQAEPIQDNLCSALLTANPDLSLPQKPGLAESVDTSNPTKIVLNLRPGVQFWDGKPMTPADVVYSLERTWKLPTSAWSSYMQNVKTITETGPLQVTINMIRHDSTLPNLLSTQLGEVMEKAYSQRVGKALGTPQGGLMCTGPYKLQRWTPGNEIVITRNPSYWGKPALAAKVVFKFITNPATLVDALETGSIDGAADIPTTTIPALAKATNGHLIAGPAVNHLVLWGPYAGSVMDDRTLREALSMAIDRQAIANVVYYGVATPLHSVLMPAMWAGPPEVEAMYRKAYEALPTNLFSHNVQAAKALVAQSGFKGRPITIGYENDMTQMQGIGAILQQEGARIGLNIGVKAMPTAAFQTAWLAGPSTRAKYGVDFLMQPTIWGVPYPGFMLSFLYGKGAPFNYTNYRAAVPEVAALTGAVTPVAAARATIAAQAKFTRDLIDIPLLSVNNITFESKRLTGAPVTSALTTTPWAANVGAAP